MNEEKYICHKCVSEEYVNKFIRKSGKSKRRCSYCNRSIKNVDLEVVAEMLHKVFSENYEQPTEGEFYYNCGEPGISVIQDELRVDEEPAADIFAIMQDVYNDYHGIEVIYCETFHYVKVKRDGNALGWAWEEMELSLKSEARYFNQHVKKFLDELFSDIESMKTGDSEKAIKDVQVDTVLYRARAFENYEDVEAALEHPERFFGPPPYKLARSGRMNAHGIPVFYGATSSDIAVAEVRPVVGNFVVVVAFRTLRELKILNISTLNNLSSKKGSIFDERVAEHNKKASFMRTLARKLTMPASGKKPENEYLITQAVSEYLAISDRFNLDGISFGSTQYYGKASDEAGQQNVVLFNKSSKIINAESNEKSFLVKLFEHIEDDEYAFYPVIHPYCNDEKKEKWLSNMRSEEHPYTLELILDRIKFHEIKGVKYDSLDTEVDIGSAIIKEKKTATPDFGLDDY